MVRPNRARRLFFFILFVVVIIVVVVTHTHTHVAMQYAYLRRGSNGTETDALHVSVSLLPNRCGWNTCTVHARASVTGCWSRVPPAADTVVIKPRKYNNNAPCIYCRTGLPDDITCTIYFWKLGTRKAVERTLRVCHAYRLPGRRGSSFRRADNYHTRPTFAVCRTARHAPVRRY